MKCCFHGMMKRRLGEGKRENKRKNQKKMSCLMKCLLYEAVICGEEYQIQCDQNGEMAHHFILHCSEMGAVSSVFKT